MKKKLVLISFLFVAVLSSCKKDFVSLQSPTGLTNESFYKTDADVFKALTGVYYTLIEKGMYSETLLILGDTPSDNVDAPGDNGAAGSSMRNLDTYQYNSDNYFTPHLWASGFRGISRANILLEKLEDPRLVITDNNKNLYKAEALFLRSLFYFDLTISFGDIPLITSNLNISDFYKLHKTSQAEIYKQIEEDLETASAILPETQPQLGRVTKGAALALLSRIYLYDKKYDKVVDVVSRLKNLNTQYELYTGNYADLFNGRAENTKENIFSVMSAPSGFSIFSFNSSNIYSYYWSPNFSWAFPYFAPTINLINSFETGDIRRKGDILLVGAGDTFDCNHDGIPDSFPSPDKGERIIYTNNANTRKFLPEGRDLTDRNNSFYINYPVIRYAEVLLNNAEALNELNKSNDALAEVNQVRERAQLPDLTLTDQTGLRDAIFHERRIELCFEGQRFFDLVRTGRAASVLAVRGFKPGDEHFAIPQTEIDFNPNLGH